ncbi:MULTISPECIES: gliding motility-associated C-terminal domain-containing protein [Mucilaginibacter]|uniref:Gliding motility-associated C-terminal domain-containing protein n=1 Tax=Mucilaginibacter rubeus TaxID=2027860 RepID=A0ABX7UI91_9SPHI|nr:MULTISPECIES: gliding motility-associated C-terminal domain-containing protein [Mucilaginibacter]QTE45153.1 gliding motility-associated C-terminal domain-containing protein [Mucilaginibacter rubeus]QTE51750.1 gliding motility-associated C-terminal domain-containing protein [Mucilaginibacter rubeus]QTE56835.1 gliding motility-associated C-terminal domain-containing protein [Mucilaginibacter rubeus]QTE63700.1 gliding motility-associated C-terminal domain-containing protein [Mucilaginibacter ru
MCLFSYTPGLFAQAPVIKYTTPHKYKINDPIPTLAPTNTGGAVPATIYGQVNTIAGSPTISIFIKVTGVAVDAAGNVFVADWGDNTIFKLTPSGNLSKFAGHSFPGLADGQGVSAAFNAPDALVLDAAGNLYVSDQQNNVIRKITPGGLVSTFAGTDSEAGVNNPRGLAIDNAGNLYVADQGNNVIRKITAAGVVTTYAGNGTVGANNGPAASASFNTPTAVGLDAAGNLYVSDSGNSIIRKISPAGVVSTFATGFNFPRELRVDGTGNVYVAEQYGNTIKKISPNGTVTIIAGGGKKDANGVAAIFNGPIGLAMDGKGNLFVGESAFVRKITLTGYTIDKPLPAGLVFDPKTGIISGTPSVLSPPTVYTVTAWNATGSSSTTLSIEVVQDITLLPSVITFPVPEVVNMSIDNILHPGATSTNTNTETPITYTSSNANVAVVSADGQIHAIAPGQTVITAYQAANDEYLAAVPVPRTFTITQDQVITFPAIAAKTTCDPDFLVGATSSNSTIPLTYVSSNPAIATVSATGAIHIIAAGSTTIIASQSGNDLYNAATPKSQILTVTAPVVPSVNISPTFYAGCEGMEVTYTANAMNEGIHPSYQWQVNGQNSGNHSDTYASSSLHAGDIITCVVTNNDGCEPVSSPVSNQASLSADPNVTLSVTITSSFSGTITAGTAVTFKAQPSNVQDNPVYQWYVNGQTVGSNSATFTSNTLADGDVVSCTMASGGTCIINPVVNSNVITVAVTVPEKIIVPNTFTPNADGYNDTWFIPGLLSYTNCTVNIYNRYGAIMYRSVGYQQPWDGTSNGKTVPAGAYYYVIDTKSSSGKLNGEVTVLR